MFLYGCSYVLRNISLLNHTVVLYDTKKILEELNMTKETFCEIMVLSGTDYNINSNTSIKETIQWYYKYLNYKEKNKGQDTVYSFYIWLVKNTKYIIDYNKLIDVYNMFHYNFDSLKDWENIEIINKTVDKEKVKYLMEDEGFIFSDF
jgi:hypothetical protein